MNEAEAYHQFKNGLKPFIQEKIDELDINNLQELKEEAIWYDDLRFYHKTTSHWSEFKGSFACKPDRWGIHKINKKDSRSNKETVCFKCGQKGHIQRDCKAKKPHHKKETPKNTSKLNQVTVKVKKLNSNATLPVYKTKSAAGADIKPCIDREIRPHSTRKVPTGLALELLKEYHLEVKARSSLLLKNITINGIIDPDYRNEIFLIIANLNDYPVSFSKDSEGLGQIIIKGHEQANFEEVAELTPTDRKGGFGSTNTKVEAVSIHPGKLFFNGTLNKNAKTTFLLDSGADSIFCGQNIAREAKLKLTPLKKAITITMADGKDHFIKNMAKEVPYHIQGFSDTLDLYVMPVDHDHILLGNHWLDRINPAID